MIKLFRRLLSRIHYWFTYILTQASKQIQRAGEFVKRGSACKSHNDIEVPDYRISYVDAIENCVAAAIGFWHDSIPEASLSAQKRQILLAAIEEQYRLGLSRSFIASVSSDPYYNGFESDHSRKSAYDRYKSACEKAGLSPKEGGDHWLHGACLICTIDTDNWEVSYSPGVPDLKIVIYPKRNPA